MHFRTKKRAILVASLSLVAFLIVFMIVAFLRGTMYLIIETNGHGGSAIWHDNECFIFAGHQVSGKVIKRYQALLEVILETQIVLPKHLQDDMVVYRIKDERLERYVVKGIGSGGGAFPYQGHIYFFRGGDAADYPYLWEWTETNFVRVAKAQALAILDAFPSADGVAHSVTAQIHSEGWHEEPNIIFTSEAARRYPIDLKGRSLVLITSDAQKGSLVLEGRIGSNSREVLSSIGRPAYRQVSESEFLDIKRSQNQQNPNN